MIRADEVLALLAAHRSADAAEAAHRARMIALVQAAATAAPATPPPWDRALYEPGHFTASAFILSPEGDAFLLLHHGRLGRWLQPGGHVDPGDASLLGAARREAEEEVGLGALPLDPRHDGGRAFDLDIHRIPAFGDAPAHDHYDVRFLLRAASRRPRPTAEGRPTRWVPLRALALDPASDASVRRAASKLL